MKINQTSRPGLGMVEMLIALAITSMLLCSVAVAFHASLNSIDENQKIATATQNARLVLNRLMTEARRAKAVECLQATPGKITIIPPEGGAVTQTEYELKGDTLWYTQTQGEVPTSHAVLMLADGVIIHEFTASVLHVDENDDTTPTRTITARLDLQVGNNRFAVTASTDPRGNIQW